MPNPLRTGLTSLFSDAPMMAFELAERCGAPRLGPRATIQVEPRELVDPLDPDRRHQADLVLVAYDEVEGERAPVLALAIEILLERDAERLAAWDLVPRAFFARYGCPGRVFIVSPIPEVRAWANEQLTAQAQAAQARARS